MSTVFTAGRYVLALYAAGATVLTTACLALHAFTAADRRTLQRRAARGTARSDRPLFIRLETPPAPLSSAD